MGQYHQDYPIGFNGVGRTGVFGLLSWQNANTYFSSVPAAIHASLAQEWASFEQVCHIKECN